eukprot:SAG22_NODE_1156_length_5335_cov_2.046600_1_plen_648_part_10
MRPGLTHPPCHDHGAHMQLVGPARRDAIMMTRRLGPAAVPLALAVAAAYTAAGAAATTAARARAPRASVTVEAAPGWEATWEAPVIVAGIVNTTALEANASSVPQMLTDSLAISCLFFSLERENGTHLFSSEQYYGHGVYSSAGNYRGRPYAFSATGGRRWNQSGCATGHCHDNQHSPSVGKTGPVTMKGEPLIADVPNQAFWPRDREQGTLRAVGGNPLCACAGAGCYGAAMLNKTGRPYGGCRIEGPNARPAAPLYNFSSARTLQYTANASTGLIDTAILERPAIFYGLPRPVWPNCSKVNAEQTWLPGSEHSVDHPDGRISTSDNPLRLSDGSLLVQVAVCLGDRPLGYGGSCGPNNTGSPCMAPTQVVYRSVDEGTHWRYQGTLFNPADYPWSSSPTAMSECALAELADGKTLIAVARMDGDCGCGVSGTWNKLEPPSRGECGVYRYYYQSFSTDRGETWSKAEMLPGMGCVKPRLMLIGGSGAGAAVDKALLLSGGRLCKENVTDLFVWINGGGMAGFKSSSRSEPSGGGAAAGGGGEVASEVWRKHSLSYLHNLLWQGSPVYKYDKSINDSTVFATQGYTTLLQTSRHSALVAYNRYYHPGNGVPGCYIDKGAEVCSTAFVMKVTLKKKTSSEKEATTTKK